jgi:hypothetical protein
MVVDVGRADTADNDQAKEAREMNVWNMRAPEK